MLFPIKAVTILQATGTSFTSRQVANHLPGGKVSIYWFRNYLVLVGSERRPGIGPASAPPNRGKAIAVTIYDLQNKLIAFSDQFPEVQFVSSEWGCIYVVTGDNKVRKFCSWSIVGFSALKFFILNGFLSPLVFFFLFLSPASAAVQD
jgi:hypothetical protein